MLKKNLLFIPCTFLLFVLSACSNVTQPDPGPDITVNIDPDLPTVAPEPTAETEQIESESLGEPENNNAVTTSGDGYPAPEVASDPGYPSPSESGQPEPPDPERNIEVVSQDTGSAGGVLVRELSDNGGFQPIKPVDLYLAEMILDTNGNPVFVGKTDGSPSANLFETGVFIFQSVVPDTYGLIIDLGFAEFPITEDNGDIKLVEIQAGEAIDLGQLFVTLP